MHFVYAVAPHHPLAALEHPLCDEELRGHRAVAVADSTQRGSGITHDLFGGPGRAHRAHHAAQTRGPAARHGRGYLPLPLAQPYIDAGRLIVKTLAQPRGPRSASTTPGASHAAPARRGRALRWWLDRLQHATTRDALLHNHHQS